MAAEYPFPVPACATSETKIRSGGGGGVGSENWECRVTWLSNRRLFNVFDCSEPLLLLHRAQHLPTQKKKSIRFLDCCLFCVAGLCRVHMEPAIPSCILSTTEVIWSKRLGLYTTEYSWEYGCAVLRLYGQEILEWCTTKYNGGQKKAEIVYYWVRLSCTEVIWSKNSGIVYYCVRLSCPSYTEVIWTKGLELCTTEYDWAVLRLDGQKRLECCTTECTS